MIGKERASNFSDEFSESLNIGKEMMVGEDRTIVLQLQSLLTSVDEEDHERFLQGLIDVYNDPNTNFQLLDLIEQRDKV